ncbi:glycosyltransferase family 2 protein [Stieleria magnilauensis]
MENPVLPADQEPDVSVLMTVYNGMPYLAEAVESIRAQTYSRWKMIIVDDGSTDESGDYLDSLDDDRITVLHQDNAGTAVASNHGLKLCDTEFLARMDSDDICDPTRLEKQVAFLRDHPSVGLVGSQIVPRGAQKAGRVIPLATDHQSIYSQLRKGQHAMCHPTILMRTALLKGIGGYWKQHGMFDAWDMFLRMGEVGELANLPEPLLEYRIHTGSINGKHMRKLQASIEFACELARRREENLPEIAYEDYFAQRERAGLANRLAKQINVYALLQYRLASIDLLGGHRLRGYARLAWSGLCSPGRSVNRLLRQLKLA